MEYTFGEEVVADPYHILMIRTPLNKNLGVCFPDVRDEIVQSFDDVLALEGNGTSQLFVVMTTNP